MDILRYNDSEQSLKVLEQLSRDYSGGILSNSVTPDSIEVRMRCIDSCINHGGILIGTRSQEPVLFLGYTMGQPSKNFKDKETFYLYLLLIAKQARGSGVFLDSLSLIEEEVKTRQPSKIAWKSHVGNDYNLGLYRKLGNLRGIAFNAFGTNSYIFESTPKRLRQLLERCKRKH